MRPNGLRSMARSLFGGAAELGTGPLVLERSARDRNIAQFKREATVVYLGDSRALCRILGRYKLYVDCTDKSLAPHLMLDGFWEIWVTEAISQLVKPGMTCVDAGANLGYFTLLMADLVGPHGRVYAFEPNPPIAAALADSITVNGFAPRVSLQTCLLEDRDDAYMQLSVPPGFAGGAAMLPPVHGQDLDTLYRTKRMDSFPELMNADVIKIDAEGAEYVIWKGMTGILAQNRPLSLLIEFVACRYADPAQFLASLVESGMSLSFVDPVDGVVPTTPEFVLAAPATHEFMLFARRSKR